MGAGAGRQPPRQEPSASPRSRSSPLRTLEQIVRPPYLARAWPRDLLAAGLLAALAVVLVPSLRLEWGLAFGAAPRAESPSQIAVAHEDPVQAVTRKMVSPALLMSMGMLLCLRCGAIDLSVWVVSGLGGVVAAGCIRAGWPTLPAMGLGLAAGACVGAVQGLLVAGARLPSPAVTAVVGLALMWSMQAVCPRRQLEVPPYAFAGWQIAYPVPAQGEAGGPAAPPRPRDVEPFHVTRAMLAASVYTLVMLVLLASDWLSRRRGPGWLRRASPGSRAVLWGAMATSGALAGAAGTLWLLEHSAAPVPTRLVDDLAVPVAAVLAGGAFLGGRGRGLLAGIFLPPAVLLAVLWRTEVLNFQRWGYPLQLVLLGCMVLVVQQAGRDRTAGRWARQAMPLIAALAGMAGIVLLGASVWADSFHLRRMVQLAGLLVWMFAAILIVIYRAAPRSA